MKYAGIQNGRICIISEEYFENDHLQVIELPEELSNTPIEELLLHYRYENGQFFVNRINKPAKELKIAIITNWAMECGLATYAHYLCEELIKHISDYKLFVEHNADPISLSTNIPSDKIIGCWVRGQSLTTLVQAIKRYQPDIVLINHEFGLFPDAKQWLAMQTQLSDFRVITIQHSVFHHRDKTICEAPLQEIVVHLEGAKTVLQEEKGVCGQIYVVPHGCLPCVDRSKLWNFYRSEHTFMQMGFGFRYKNFEHSIRAAAFLKEKYSDIFFTAIISESKHNKIEHDRYYRELLALISALHLEENVAILRGFQTDTVIDSYLRTNQVAVFPYASAKDAEVFGASGAARIAFSVGIPVISSSIPHFSDLPTIKANSPEEIATELDKLFCQPQWKEQQIIKQIRFTEENSWSQTAKRFLSIFEASPGNNLSLG